jgi:hypothetical protein
VAHSLAPRAPGCSSWSFDASSLTEGF